MRPGAKSAICTALLSLVLFVPTIACGQITRSLAHSAGRLEEAQKSSELVDYRRCETQVDAERVLSADERRKLAVACYKELREPKDYGITVTILVAIYVFALSGWLPIVAGRLGMSRAWRWMAYIPGLQLLVLWRASKVAVVHVDGST